jgi:formylmethanofuran dehydrogenase subunit D
MQFSTGDLATLKVAEDGKTATARTRMLYEDGIPVITSTGMKVEITKDFLQLVADDYNKRLKSWKGWIMRRHAPLHMEHIDDRGTTVVGRLDSPMEVEQEIVNGKVRFSLFSNVFITDEDLIEDLKSSTGATYRGVSVGIGFNDKGKPVFKELSVTLDPVKKEAILLSGTVIKFEDNEDKFKTKLDIITKKVENYIKLNNELILSKEKLKALKLKKDSIKLSNARQLEVKEFLNTQVHFNKLSRVEALTLSKKCQASELETLKKVFSTVRPTKYNTVGKFIN